MELVSAYLFLSKHCNVLQYAKISTPGKEKHLGLFFVPLLDNTNRNKTLAVYFIAYSTLIPAQNVAICSFADVWHHICLRIHWIMLASSVWDDNPGSLRSYKAKVSPGFRVSFDLRQASTAIIPVNKKSKAETKWRQSYSANALRFKLWWADFFSSFLCIIIEKKANTGHWLLSQMPFTDIFVALLTTGAFQISNWLVSNSNNS